MDQKKSPEKGTLDSGMIERQGFLTVQQPQKLEGLLETINLLNEISERASEDRSAGLGGTGGDDGTQTGSSQKVSARDQAIANLPPEAELREQLAKHIEKEVKVLRKEVHKAAKRISKPGSAYKLNTLYARIRRLNSLLSSLLEASYDVVKRLFIRTFIDKQSLI